MAKVLIVESEEGIQHLLKRIVGVLGHEAYVAGSGTEAVKEVQRLHPDLIITDLCLPGEPSGVRLVRALHAHNAALPIIVTTGYTPRDMAEALKAEGIKHILSKPFDVIEVRTLIASLIGNARAR